MILFIPQRRRCEQCHKSFNKSDELTEHMKSVHRQPVFKCRNCGKEFLHEKDRLHHVREENERKTDARRHSRTGLK